MFVQFSGNRGRDHKYFVSLKKYLCIFEDHVKPGYESPNENHNFVCRSVLCAVCVMHIWSAGLTQVNGLIVEIFMGNLYFP